MTNEIVRAKLRLFSNVTNGVESIWTVTIPAEMLCYVIDSIASLNSIVSLYQRRLYFTAWYIAWHLLHPHRNGLLFPLVRSASYFSAYAYVMCSLSLSLFVSASLARCRSLRIISSLIMRVLLCVAPSTRKLQYNHHARRFSLSLVVDRSDFASCMSRFLKYDARHRARSLLSSRNTRI